MHVLAVLESSRYTMFGNRELGTGTIAPMATARNVPSSDDRPERLVSAAPIEDDSSFELKLRPQRLAEFIGQKKVKENLAVAIEAARSRGEAMDHVLLYGPP